MYLDIIAPLWREIFPEPAVASMPMSTKFLVQLQLSSSFSNMATAVVEDVMQDEEPQGFQFTDFIDQEEEFAGFDEKDDVHHDDKDSTEEELERLVFGDSAGFRTELKKARQITKVESQQGKEDEEQEETGLESARDDAVRLDLTR